MKNWTEDFFTDFYQDLFMSRTWDDSLNTIYKINKLFNSVDKTVFKNKTTLLDQCCGIGDLVAGWNSLGVIATGVEYQKNYIQKGLKEFSLLNENNLIQADACNITFSNPFDLVVNWNSSFGFFNHEKNYVMLENAYQNLKEGGLFLIESFNSIFWIKSFKPHMEFKKQLKGEDVLIKRDSFMDVIDMQMQQKWHFISHTHNFEYQTKVKAYLPHEIINMLKKIGFKVMRVLDEKEEEFNLNSERLLIISQK